MSVLDAGVLAWAADTIGRGANVVDTTSLRENWKGGPWLLIDGLA